MAPTATVTRRAARLTKTFQELAQPKRFREASKLHRETFRLWAKGTHIKRTPKKSGARKSCKKVRWREVFNRKCFAKLKAKMNFDDIVWLPLHFCVCVFHPFLLLLAFFIFRLFQCLFQNIFCVNFLLTYLLFQRMKASNVCMSVQMCYKTFFACSFAGERER